MNKKELAKNEEDIIETYSNSLTVHETKLKVSSRANIDQWFQCQCIILVFVAENADLSINFLTSQFLWYDNLIHVLYLHISKLYALQVDLTQYVEKHEFVFDAVLNEEVTNDEVTIVLINVQLKGKTDNTFYILT